MVKENGMVMMTESEFMDTLGKAHETSEKLQTAEQTINELSRILLKMKREDEPETGETLVSLNTFLSLYNSCFKNDSVEDDIYNHDVFVSWHGFRCNCQDGATACNYIIDGVEHVADEIEF